MLSVMQRNSLEYPWQPPKKAAEKKCDKFISNLVSVKRNGQFASVFFDIRNGVLPSAKRRIKPPISF